MSNNTQLDYIKSRIRKPYEEYYSFSGIHGSDCCCFENIAFSVGFYQDIITDKEIVDYYEFYLEKFRLKDELVSSDFVNVMVLNGLLYAGRKLNRCDEILVEAFLERLSHIYNFALEDEILFYNDEERKQFKSIPKSWKNVPIMRYEHVNPYLKLPLVYDLLGYSVMYGKNKEADKMIDKIMDYIFSTGYQDAVMAGYGIGINGDQKGFLKSKYYAVGWELHVRNLPLRQKIVMMLLFSTIPGAVNSEWYRTSKNEITEALRMNDEVYLSEILTSARKTYWTSGCYIDFGRSKKEKIDRISEIVMNF